MTTLRWYQQEAVDAVFRYWQNGGPGSPLVELPTGSGKSLVLAAIAQRLVRDFGARVIIATHRKELIDQDARAVRALWPDAPVGVFSAGLNSRRIDTITVGGIQSLLPHAKRHGIKAPGVVIVDEAHLVSTDESTQYGQLFDMLRADNPDMRLVGLTATPYRLGQGLLTSGPGALFSTVAYRADILRLVDEGFLSPLVSPSTSATISTADARTQAGEWVLRDLELAADLAEVNNAVARDVAGALSQGRTSALVFSVTVAHATHLAAALTEAGIGTRVVTGETTPLERAAALADFKARKLQCICSCDVLTTGFDAPCTDVLALVRPTKSPGLYVQMVGRGMRRADGKSDCLLLDYGGNVARHGPITAVKPPEQPRGNGKGAAPVKTCPQCMAEVPTDALACIHCDYEFPPPEKKANAAASVLDPMSQVFAQEHTVGTVQCSAWTSRSSGKTTLRVEYLDLNWLPIASEYICLEHDGYARQKAERWWASHFDLSCPETVEKAVEFFKAGHMRTVVSIVVVPDGKYTRVKSVKFSVRQREPGDDDAPAPFSNLPPIEMDEIPF